MKIQFTKNFEEIISPENILEAWGEFLRGKRMKYDVLQFSMKLMDNIVALHKEIASKTYSHGGYHAFNISDPKPRSIHKASVRDRLLHHALYRQLYPFFSKTFIADSFSCQLEKGTHKALQRFQKFFYKVSKNNTRTCWALKCDIRKFFANVDHAILKNILHSYIVDKNLLALLENVIDSFEASPARPGVGLPLGNLTSQLFVNVYMNKLDQFAKHTLKAKFYLRYCDDFVILSEDKKWLENLIPRFSKFLSENLGLELHPNKVFIKTIVSGVDFLGWTHFHNHRVPRFATQRRMMKRIKKSPTTETLNSYLGLLKHGNTKKLKELVVKEYYLSQEV